MAEDSREDFLSQLAINPNSVHKAPVNRYQHFVNASVYLSCGIKRADAVRRAQEDWKRRASTSEEYFSTIIKQAEAKMKSQKTKPIRSYFTVQVRRFIYYVQYYRVQSDHSDLALDTFTYFYNTYLLF